jgi:molybdopterin-containing oxidoreductase family iron-sulfur binding subunit
MKTPPDPELLRERLSVAQGKRYWRGLEELAGDPAFEEMLHREFPDRAWEWADPVSRRRFLGLMGASLALAGLSGCAQRPRETIWPYVRQPENMVPGKPLFYATTRPLSGFGAGVLVENHEGRPTKIEGNPLHPASRGATDVFAQAAILDFYDPDRSQTINYRGQVRTWSRLLEELRRRLSPDGPRKSGKGVALLTEAVGSPTLSWQLDRFLKEYPEARWYVYEPCANDNAIAGARLAFGRPLNVYYRLDRADVIVALDADFLGSGPAQLVYTHDWAQRRRDLLAKKSLSRLYSVEATLTITGAAADNRLALRPTAVEGFARALAVKLGADVEGRAELEGPAGRWLDAVAADLREVNGKPRPAGTTLVVAGDGQPPVVHALAHAINQRLGNFGKTVVFTEPVLRAGESMASLKELFAAVEGGTTDTLLVLGGNPAYTAPADVPVDEILTKKLLLKDWLAVHLGNHEDETSRLCHWHVPETHFLETWGDARAFDGTASIIQPLIAPLYAGRSAHEILAALSRRKEGNTASEYDERTPYELVREYWQGHRPAKSAKDEFERFWRTAVHNGVIEGTNLPEAEAPALRRVAEGGRSRPVGELLEVIFVPDPAVYDGRFANNGWLQELPKPVTKLTWDNAALMSPATATALGVRDRIGQRKGGEHGDMIAGVVRITVDGREVEAPVWRMPGHADGTITLHLGYGRRRVGRVGNEVGFDVNKLRTSAAPYFAAGATVTKVEGKTHTLACTQGHFTMAGRDPARSATLATYKKAPHFATEHDAGGPKRHELPTLYPDDHKYDGKYKWGMAIDLSACTGCSACVVACQAENNIPVVGKDQVTRGREMHWLRIDRYFVTPRAEKEPVDELRVHFQPVMCQHCEKAPCELVCPVEATVHGEEGTNDMVYNRCVGTRYCSNNCPYKVRRFNFLEYAKFDTPSLKLMYNPDVTVRSRGVMEKCTFCIQRIAYARIESSKEALDESGHGGKRRVDPNRPGLAYIRDGEVVTACQAACPADAIVFGDLNDPKSRVAKLHESPLRYDLLGDLGIRPRVAYLAAVHNPNPALPGE